jgi:diacylglycerol kinase (ATP)
VSSPFGPLLLVANPNAGRGAVAAQLPGIEDQLRTKGLDYRVHRTSGPGDATRATRAALVAGETFIVAVGGDGTVHEVVNGMFEDGEPVVPTPVLGVIAAGSGCDFVKSFGLPDDAIRACGHLEGSNTFPIDVGRVTYIGADGGEETRHFPNIAEVGLGAAVVARAARLPRFVGRARYFVAFWLTLPGFKRTVVSVRADGKSFEGGAHQVVVANCLFFGGGMMISPRSWPGDGFLEVLVFKGPKSDSFRLLPKIYRGEHLPNPNIVELRARTVSIDGEHPLPVEADGEVLGRTPATFEVVPQAIRVKI